MSKGSPPISIATHGASIGATLQKSPHASNLHIGAPFAAFDVFVTPAVLLQYGAPMVAMKLAPNVLAERQSVPWLSSLVLLSKAIPKNP